MEMNAAVEQLAALGNASRLSVFRLLVKAGPTGLSAGIIAERLRLPPATLSFHLASLHHAGLLSSRQESRFVYYSVDFTVVDGLLAYLVEDCCQGVECLPKTAAVRAKACC
ncbi:MAG: helix-turn-helix transcriptional regulator [Arenimonas sp.]|nr:helix-turn-helix transcriptional regulator [Arenimonas sp.]MBP7917171.1 helix-turn-helix transcriptional regulator [Arenimonas sp.]